MQCLIIGNGEIGASIRDLIIKAGFSLTYHDPPKQIIAPDQSYDIIHICIPLNEQLPPEEYRRQYLDLLQRWHLRSPSSLFLIHSTLDLPLTQQIRTTFPMCYYIPLRGTHTQIDVDLTRFLIYVGCFHAASTPRLQNYLTQLGFKNQQYVTAEEACLAKLFSVVWFGINLALIQEFHLICEKEHVDFTKAYRDYTLSDEICQVYTPNEQGIVQGHTKQPRPCFYPSHIGGKCVIQDELLLQATMRHPEWIELCLNLNREYAEDDR